MVDQSCKHIKARWVEMVKMCVGCGVVLAWQGKKVGPGNEPQDMVQLAKEIVDIVTARPTGMEVVEELLRTKLSFLSPKLKEHIRSDLADYLALTEDREGE